MTGHTTIKLSDDTKKLLDDENMPDESFDDTVRRLLGETKGQAWTKQEIEDIALEAVSKHSRRQSRGSL